MSLTSYSNFSNYLTETARLDITLASQYQITILTQTSLKVLTFERSSKASTTDLNLLEEALQPSLRHCRCTQAVNTRTNPKPQLLVR